MDCESWHLRIHACSIRLLFAYEFLLCFCGFFILLRLKKFVDCLLGFFFFFTHRLPSTTVDCYPFLLQYQTNYTNTQNNHSYRTNEYNQPIIYRFRRATIFNRRFAQSDQSFSIHQIFFLLLSRDGCISQVLFLKLLLLHLLYFLQSRILIGLMLLDNLCPLLYLVLVCIYVQRVLPIIFSFRWFPCITEKHQIISCVLLNRAR